VTSQSSLQLLSDSEEATSRLGDLLAAVLQPGSIVALQGDLGAGKTRLVKAIAAGLGVPPEGVNSPTFTLIHEYAGRIPLRHCDTYRLKDPDELLDLGLDDLLDTDGIALIEWADRVLHLLPRDLLRIEIQILSPTTRQLTITATGQHSTQALDNLRDRLSLEAVDS
jgi:tRNA threonylcarbamoyladenosine biosynthesis protein TsaE